jgi:hypothetical protein
VNGAEEATCGACGAARPPPRAVADPEANALQAVADAVAAARRSPPGAPPEDWPAAPPPPPLPGSGKKGKVSPKSAPPPAAALQVPSPVRPAKPPQPGPRSPGGPPLDAETAFPHAVDVDYGVRAATRMALYARAAELGLGEGVTGGGAPGERAGRLAPTAAQFLLAPLEPVMEAALHNLFTAWEEPSPIALWEAAGRKGRPPTLNRIKERLRRAIEPLNFAATLTELLGTPLHPEDLASLVKNLRLDEMGRVSHAKFTSFCALPLTRRYVCGAGEAAPTAAPLGAGEEEKEGGDGGGGGGGTPGSPLRPASPAPPLARSARARKHSHEEDLTALAAAPRVKDDFVVYSAEGAPRPLSSPLSPVKHTALLPGGGGGGRGGSHERLVHGLGRGGGGAAAAATCGATAAAASPWDALPPGFGGRRPRISVAWPVDVSVPGTPFWAGVASLETAMAREVKRRALIAGALPEESMEVAAAGAGVELSSVAEGSSTVELLGSRKTLSGFVAPENLKRAFMFFNRQKAGGLGFSVDDLHATLAELGHVDAPAAARRPSDLEVEAAGAEGRLGGGDGAAEAVASAPPPPDKAPVLVGLTSPSRLKLPLGSGGGSPLRRGGSAGSPTRRSGSGGSGPTVALVPAPPASFSARAASDAAAMELAWELGMTEGGGVLLEPTLPFGHAAPPPFDPLADSLAAGARALVTALFRRLRGHGDPGKMGAAVRGFSLRVEPEDRVTFVNLVQWCAPLGKALVRMRQRVQAAFLASASTGGGGKDFEKAFRKVDENGDGVMSMAEFSRALGPLKQHLSPAELQELVDNFDMDGSGVRSAPRARKGRRQHLTYHPPAPFRRPLILKSLLGC